MAGGTDEHRFSGQHVPNDLKAQSRDGDAFTGHNVFRLAVRFTLAIDQRTNAVRVPERQQAVAGNHRYTRVATADSLVDCADGTKNRLDVHVGLPFNSQSAASLSQFNGERIQQQLGIAGRVDVSHAIVPQETAQFLSIGQVAVVGKSDAVG